MKIRILNIRLAIVYRLAKFTNKASTWFCNRHTMLHEEWKREFYKYKWGLK
jgi:hypothetical protein